MHSPVPCPLPFRRWDTLSIVVCARNEEARVVEQLHALAQAFPGAELILVDNASTDRTAELASQVQGVRVVCERQPGKGHAMRAGARHASRTWLLFHDADNEYLAADATAVALMAMAHDTAAVGARLVSYDALLPSSWLANALVSWLLRLRTGQRVPDVLSGTRCLRRELFLELATEATHFGIETEITRKLALQGLKTIWVPVRFFPRSRAEGKKIRARHLPALIYQALHP